MAIPCSPSTAITTSIAPAHSRRDSMSRFISLSSTKQDLGHRFPTLRSFAGPQLRAACRHARRRAAARHRGSRPRSSSAGGRLLGQDLCTWPLRRVLLLARRSLAVTTITGIARQAARALCMRLEELEAVHLRHHQIEQDQRRAADAPSSQASASRPFAASATVPALLLQRAAHHARGSSVVVHDQQLRPAVAPSDTGWSKRCQAGRGRPAWSGSRRRRARTPCPRSSTIVTIMTGMSRSSGSAFSAASTAQPSMSRHHDVEGDRVRARARAPAPSASSPLAAWTTR